MLTRNQQAGSGHVMDMSVVTAGPQSGELFDRYAEAVYTYLFRRLDDWSEAEDLTSAVFLQAWRRRSDVVFDRDSALPWLFGVASGLARNATRARRRHAALLARVRDRIPESVGAAADHADAVAERLDSPSTRWQNSALL
jgi:DNA-directed RNA polymerase specialized sigma24 family protein